MRILVVGGSGLIGGHVMRALKARGHRVVGAGRNLDLARRLLPGFEWVGVDLGRSSSEAWKERLSNVDVVVNAAGLLQDGLGDDLRAVHVTGVKALLAGCRAAGVRRIVLISAAGVMEGRGDAFTATKAEGEAEVRASGLEWTILRPALVLAPSAYGGTALLRGLAGFPGFVPALMPEAPIQVVGVDMVAAAVIRSVDPATPDRLELDLAGVETLPLREVLLRLRTRLGFRVAPLIAVPGAVGWMIGKAADALGWLGWRTPMRSNARKQIAAGMGSLGGGEAALGLEPQTLDQVLETLPSTVQERRFARLYFVKPAILASLSALCGGTALISQTAGYASARAILEAAGMKPGFAVACIAGGAAVDLALAIGIAVRPWSSQALMALLAVTACYLAIGAAIRPDLWTDPLGGMLKTFVVMLLAVVALAMGDDR